MIALTADALQIFVFPAFWEGFLSPLNDALDVVVAGLLIWLLGWHWALLPSLIAELIPGWDLVPNWTAAVYLVTIQGSGGGVAPGVPPVMLPPPAEPKPPAITEKPES